MRAYLLHALLVVLSAGFLVPFPASADDLVVIGYNVESDSDTKWTVVAEDMKLLGAADIWGLSEVQNRTAVRVFRQAAKDAAAVAGVENSRYYYLLGTEGSSDRLAIVYNESRLEHLDVFELKEEVGGSRPPLVAHFRILDGGQEFLFMVNHLNRGDAGKRRAQAVSLNSWAQTIDLPVIAVGDYNLDWDVSTQLGNKAFRLMLDDDHWDWVEPQCGSDGDFSDCQPTQCNPAYDSILDFVFLAGPARQWRASSEIIEPRDNYCTFDNSGGADHLPLRATIAIPAPEGGGQELSLTNSRPATSDSVFENLMILGYQNVQIRLDNQTTGGYLAIKDATIEIPDGTTEVFASMGGLITLYGRIVSVNGDIRMEVTDHELGVAIAGVTVQNVGRLTATLRAYMLLQDHNGDDAWSGIVNAHALFLGPHP